VQDYIPGGIEAAAELEAVLAAFDRKFSDFDAIYDFGAGRSWLRRVAGKGKPGAAFDGSDVDAPAIEWARANLASIRWKVSNYRPPAPDFAESFDLVYSISILTHFNEQMQFEWLGELHRLMKPGALGLLTIHGEHAYGEARSGAFVSNSRSCAERVQGHGNLSEERFIYEPYEITSWNEGEFPGVDDTFGSRSTLRTTSASGGAMSSMSRASCRAPSATARRTPSSSSVAKRRVRALVPRTWAARRPPGNRSGSGSRP
jgi:hypothetical protein